MIYIAGYMTTGDFGGGPGAYQAASTGSPNIFIAKINPALSGPDSLLYFTYLGGSGADIPFGMQLDAAGNIYLTGATSSVDFPLGGTPALSANAGGSSDAFILKFNPALDGAAALVFSTYLGGTDAEVGYAIDVDQQGFIYVTGTTQSMDFPLTATAYAAVRYGNSDAFIVKVDPFIGAFTYSSYLGGESTEQGRAIAVAPSGMVYFAGDTVSTMFPLAGNSYMPTPFGGGDIFVAQMDLTKSGVESLVYSTYLGGSGLDAVRKMVVDSSGKLLLTGYTLSPDLPVTPDALQSTLNGIANVFVTRLDLAGAGNNIISYSTYFGGSGGDVAYDMTTDSTGNVYLTGYTNSVDFPVTPDALQVKTGGGFDVFVSRLNLGGPGPGSVVYSTYTGKTSINVGYGIAVSPTGAIAVGGQSGAQDELPSVNVTDNSIQPVFAGGQSDGFVMFLRPN
jgi:Beta-propeller repeat